MSKQAKRTLALTLITLGSIAATIALMQTRVFRVLNFKVLDSHFVLRGPKPTKDIMLVLADQKALDSFHDLQLFWHPHYANVIRAAGMGGAKAVGLDLAFGVKVEEWKPDFDRLLAEAVSTAPMPVVVASVPELNTNQQADPVQVNMIAAALGLSGFPNLTVDEDDFVRRQELFEAPSGDALAEPPAPALAFRVVEKYLGMDATLKNGVLSLAGRTIPIAADRSIYINYAGGPDTFPGVSMADVEAALTANQTARLKQWFQNKIVLVGTDSKSDRFDTPFFSSFGGEKWTTAGVEIHANTVQTLLNHDFLTVAPWWTLLLAMLLATGVTVALAAIAPTPRAVAGLLAIGLVVVGATHLLFLNGIILSTTRIMIAATIGLIGAIIYRFATAEKRGDLFQSAVSLFVSKRLSASLESGQAIGLSGKRELVTILFTDIRGFTAFSEKLCDEEGPEALVKMLNEYLATMAGIIVSYGGHVNKYIGDGILAVFADHDEGAQPGDHALRGVKCATRMVNVASEFKTGAGLHTGLVVEGNIGSADKMEYTVLGDTVNLASRLESLNKEHKTKLLMSDTTEKALRGEIKTTLLATVPVRGKTVPIQLFTVTSLLTPASDVPAKTPIEVLNA